MNTAKKKPNYVPKTLAEFSLIFIFDQLFNTSASKSEPKYLKAAGADIGLSQMRMTSQTMSFLQYIILIPKHFWIPTALRD